ncbi:MAG: nucleotidyltransferase domain-containing protein [Nitrospirae bacterium]|nr:MAG: nucleotidyltransferase domain-containing protein [Nitrospirota bacterium]
MNKNIQTVLRELKAGLRQLYGERLKGVYLFGSYARGEADEESDIDALIVLDCIENYSKEIDRTSELIARLSLECDRSISRVFVSEQRWREDQTMFFLNVREEAVPA